MITNEEKKSIRSLYSERYNAGNIKRILTTQVKVGERTHEGRFELKEIRAYIDQIKRDPTVLEIREKEKERLYSIYGRLPSQKNRTLGLLYKFTKDDAILTKLHDEGSL